MSVILWFSPSASTIYSGTLQFKKGNLIPTWKWNPDEKFQSKPHCLLIIMGVAQNLDGFTFFLKKIFTSAEGIVHWQLKFKKFVSILTNWNSVELVEYLLFWGQIRRNIWSDLFAVQESFSSLLQHHSLKASILSCSAFFMVLLSHLYMTPGKTMALTMDLCQQGEVFAF